MNSVIIGAIDGYEWKQVETWWMSIKLSEYKGDIHMLVYDISEETIEKMTAHGIHVHQCEKKHGQVVVDRFKDMAALAATIPVDTWCICTDVNDLVFQADPDYFLTHPSLENYEIVIASEGILHKGNQWVRLNATASLPFYWNEMANKVLYNAGCFAAKSQVLEQLAARVYRLCMTHESARNHDQFALNIILQLAPEFTNWTCFEKAAGTWCFSGASSIFAKPVDREHFLEEAPTIKDGLCFNYRGHLYFMFHHWNRDERIMKQVVNRVHTEWSRRILALNNEKGVYYEK